jgi:hypothetical protein
MQEQPVTQANLDAAVRQITGHVDTLIDIQTRRLDRVEDHANDVHVELFKGLKDCDSGLKEHDRKLTQVYTVAGVISAIVGFVAAFFQSAWQIFIHDKQ